VTSDLPTVDNSVPIAVAPKADDKGLDRVLRVVDPIGEVL
jgi:hypothetical protein